MRKNLITTFSTCVLLGGLLVGCAGESPEKLTNEKLESLLERMDRLEYVYSPTKENAQLYTVGTTVNTDSGDVELPGRPTFGAAYIDEAVTLIPLAEEIVKEGNTRQKQTANQIIASVRAEEGSYLINEADRVLQKQTAKFSFLRARTDMVKDIIAHNNALAGEREATIDTIQTGQIGNGQSVDGIKQLSEQVDAAEKALSAANSELEKTLATIKKLQEEALEYEALDLKLTNEASSATTDARYPKLEKAAEAMTEAELAEAKAQSLKTDVSILENQATLAQGRKTLTQGVIDELQAKITSIREERKAVADKLAKLAKDREEALTTLTNNYNEIDAMMQVGGFDRMAKAQELLVQAQEALTAANLGRNAQLQQMGLYTLRARSLHQQLLASRTYAALLGTLAASGPDVLGEGLHTTITTRITQMQDLQDAVKAAAAELNAASGDIVSSMSDLDAASSEGKAGAELVALYRKLIDFAG